MSVVCSRFDIYRPHDSLPIVEAREVGNPVWNAGIRYYPGSDVFRFEIEGQPAWVERELLLKMVMESARLGERIEEKEGDEDE